MKKDTFLTIIQGAALIEGSKANRVWEDAQGISAGDSRWSLLESESIGPDELIWQYCKYFMSEYQKPIHKTRQSQRDRWTKKLAETKAYQPKVAPEKMEAFLRNIADLEAKLEYAIKNNL